MNRPIDNIENGMVLYDEPDESDYTYDDYLADETDRRWKEEQEARKEMDDITKEPKVKKVKYSAYIPIGHRMKSVVGIFENSNPVSVEMAKFMIQCEVRNKYNTTITISKVEIYSFEILE